MEALLVHEPADQQHELLVRGGEPRAQPREVGHGLQIARVDAVRDDRHALGAEHVAHLRGHVGRADDHPVGGAGHPPLGRVDDALRMLPHAARVAAVLRGVDGDEPRHPAGQPACRVRDQPVVRVDEVEPAAQLGRREVGVHPLDPGEERVQVGAREVGLGHPVDHDPVAVLHAGAAPAGQDMHLMAEAHELLGQLAHVARQAALDHRRVLPRDGEDAHASGGELGEDPLGRERLAPVGAPVDEHVVARAQVDRQVALDRVPVVVLSRSAR